MNHINWLVDNKVFETREEAIGYADLYFARTGVLLEVTTTRRKVTHAFVSNTR